ncbi:MAG: FadR/GntR family transcriptional regulator [Spirochaetota bacterium]
MAKIRQRTVVDQVMQHMKQLIAEGVYTPGDKIPTEHELSEEFGVGRSSIREAIKIFNYLGVTRSMAARGTYISDRSHISTESLTWALLLGNDELDEVLEMRGAMELWSFIRLTELKKTDPAAAQAHIDELQKQLERMEAAILYGEDADLIQADYDFHLEIINSGKNRLFTELYLVLTSFTLREIERTHLKFEVQQSILEAHRTLLKAVVSGDITQAELTCINHINAIKTLLHPEEEQPKS